MSQPAGRTQEGPLILVAEEKWKRARTLCELGAGRRTRCKRGARMSTAPSQAEDQPPPSTSLQVPSPESRDLLRCVHPEQTQLCRPCNPVPARGGDFLPDGTPTPRGLGWGPHGRLQQARELSLLAAPAPAPRSALGRESSVHSDAPTPTFSQGEGRLLLRVALNLFCLLPPQTPRTGRRPAVGRKRGWWPLLRVCRVVGSPSPRVCHAAHLARLRSLLPAERPAGWWGGAGRVRVPGCR